MKLYIVRHGQTEWNKKKKLQGWKDSNLTELGKKQANWVGKRLEGIKFDAVFSSPLKRAKDTASIICKNRNIKINYEERLKEMHLGDWEGKSVEEVKQKNPTEYEQFWSKPHLYNRNSGETFKGVFVRVLSFLDELLKENYENVLIVAHTVIIKVLMAHFEKRELNELWNPPYIHQACLNLVDIDDEIDVIYHGDTSHYEEVESAN